jgi:nicotinate-nucleotide pyrophosphorylase (carboxylating)
LKSTWKSSDLPELEAIVSRALAEDVGAGDVTSEATVPEDARGRARIVQKQPGVVFGLAVVVETMRQCGVEEAEGMAAEAEWCEEVPADVLVASGPARGLLAAERTALNYLGHLSGVATLTARFVEAIAGTGARILDTRKTTPGLRELEKAAVAAGGGRNHRMGLFDAFLVKENHIALAGGLTQAVEAARSARPDLPVEVECRDLDDVAAALATGAEALLLDNMDAATLREAVRLRDEAARKAAGTAAVQAAGAAVGGVAGKAEGASAPTLEASGGVDLENVRAIAATGVDLVSVGALTHSAPALDFSMLIVSA